MSITYFNKYVPPLLVILLPNNILENFTKNLSLNFQLFRNRYCYCDKKKYFISSMFVYNPTYLMIILKSERMKKE